MKPIISSLEKLLDGPRDGAMLRFSLGNAWLDEDARKAMAYLRDAVRMDPDYSAAWKILGKACDLAGEPLQALEAWQQGIAVAQRHGDIQAAREMKVFARRIEKKLGAADPGDES